jgi:2-succinyl-6-hydroxy-2,4-cyclohexadiene-1-carboxylate synthase
MAPALALLHGFASDPSSWDEVRKRLDPDVAVVAPALVGHGDREDESVSDFEAEVDRLAARLRKHGDRFHLCGYSLGGRVALGLLSRHGALFTGATIVSGQPGLESAEERALRVTADEKWCRLLEERGIEAFVREWEALPLFSTQAGLDTSVLAAQRATRLRRDPRGLSHSLRATGLGVMPAYWERLGGVLVPTTLLVGGLDEKFRRIAERMARALPAARVEVVRGAGHNLVLEAPDAVATAIRRALDSEWGRA